MKLRFLEIFFRKFSAVNRYHRSIIYFNCIFILSIIILTDNLPINIKNDKFVNHYLVEINEKSEHINVFDSKYIEMFKTHGDCYDNRNCTEKLYKNSEKYIYTEKEFYGLAETEYIMFSDRKSQN